MSSVAKKSFAMLICAMIALAISALASSVVTEQAHAASAPSKTSISSITKAAKSLTVKWKKNPSSLVTGYQIRYSTVKSMASGAKTVKVTKKVTSKKITSKIKAATTYYVKIRAIYKKSGKVKYTKWSAVKSATTLVGSGDSAFDKKIESILSKTVKSTGAAGLKKAFNYVAGLRQGATVTSARSGSWTKWSVKYAKAMATRGQGNCYQAAALLAWLAKGLGYDARAVCGTYTGGNGKVSPHGWTEVKVGSKYYIFDANNQNTANGAGLSVSYHKVSKTSATGKKYLEAVQ